MIQFDTAVLFDRLGGPAALRRAVAEENGRTPAEATVAMWKSRNRIAAEWLPACVVAALRRDPDLKLNDLLVDVPDNPF